MSICGVEGCERPVYARGVCSLHYQRWQHRGTVEDGVKARGTLEERFRRKFAVGSVDECWEWTGAQTSKGYGVIQEAGKGSRNLLAHRVSYEVHIGQLAAGALVLHSCDNPSCVNPGHLRAGTQSENILEAIEKKRKFVPRAAGDDNPKSKLTSEQAAFIKAHPELKHTELAKLFGVSPNCIRGVRTGRTWKDSP
jgi:hypothetical protein